MHYYGRFPTSRLHVLVTPVRGKGAPSGTTFGSPPRIKVTLGELADEEFLRRDWMMVHEMVHLAFPRVAQQHHWIEEGLATYVEPWARLGIGQLAPETIWKDLVEGLPKGLPAADDKGLDHTPTWGRTYWGGALFCLLYFTRGRIALSRKAESVRLTTRLKPYDAWSVFGLSTEQWRF